MTGWCRLWAALLACIPMVILLHILNMMQNHQSISSRKMVNQDLIGERIVS